MKLKTHKGAAKRFKITASGKVKRHHSFARHILTKKEAGRKRKLSKATIATDADTPTIRRMLPYAYGEQKCQESNEERSGIIAERNYSALRRAITSTRASCISSPRSRSKRLLDTLIGTARFASVNFAVCGSFASEQRRA